jgi:hypothetical protein
MSGDRSVPTMDSATWCQMPAAASARDIGLAQTCRQRGALRVPPEFTTPIPCGGGGSRSHSRKRGGVVNRLSQDTLAFSALSGVCPMIETMPLARAPEAYARMMRGAARFRMVLTSI